MTAIKLFISFLFAISIAQPGMTSTAEKSELKDIMKTMGQSFKEIAIGIGSETLEEFHLESIETIQSTLSEAAQIFPETATTSDLKIDYLLLLNEVQQQALLLETEIEKAILSGDVEPATTIFDKMDNLRKKAHRIFKL